MTDQWRYGPLIVDEQGYVGLPMAVRGDEVDVDVVGIDVDENPVRVPAAGESPVPDIADLRLSAALDTAQPRASNDAAGALVLLVDHPVFDLELVVEPAGHGLDTRHRIPVAPIVESL